MAQDNLRGTPKSDRRQNPAQGQNPGSQRNNPHHSAIGEPGKRSQPNDQPRKRNPDDDVDDDVMDKDRDNEDSITGIAIAIPQAQGRSPGRHFDRGAAPRSTPNRLWGRSPAD